MDLSSYSADISNDADTLKRFEELFKTVSALFKRPNPTRKQSLARR